MPSICRAADKDVYYGINWENPGGLSSPMNLATEPAKWRGCNGTLKGVSPYIRAKFRMLLNKGNISREHSERIQFATA